MRSWAGTGHGPKGSAGGRARTGAGWAVGLAAQVEAGSGGCGPGRAGERAVGRRPAGEGAKRAGRSGGCVGRGRPRGTDGPGGATVARGRTETGERRRHALNSGELRSRATVGHFRRGGD